jgi:hypothetical protein
MFILPRRMSSHSVSAVTLLIFLLTIPPWTPVIPSFGLDESWIAVLQYAYDHGWRWGADIAITFGPLGFLYSRTYDPLVFSTALFVWSFLATSMGVGFAAANQAGPLRAIISAAGLVYCFQAFGADAFFFAIPLMLVAVWCSSQSSLRTIALACLILSSGIITQIKISAFPLCLLGAVLIDVGITLNRRIPFYTLALIAVSVTVWLGAGQHLKDIAPYMANAASTLGGYDSAMQQFGSVGELAAFFTCSLLALGTLGTLVARSQDMPLSSRFIFAAMFLAFLLISFRAGFVRHDLHSLIAWLSLVASSSILLLLPWAPHQTSNQRNLALLTPVAAALATALVLHLSGNSTLRLVEQLRPSRILDNARSAFGFVTGDSWTATDKIRTAHFSALVKQSSMPVANGSVDVIPSRQIELLMMGADYRPRPVFQGYAAYTPRLTELNKHFFESERAPDYTIFGFDEMDNRYPSTIDGSILPVLLARYEPVSMDNLLLLLRRRTETVSVKFSAPITRNVHLGVASEIWTSPTADAVWATMKVHETILGRLIRTFWKPPVVGLTVTDAFEHKRSYRLVPGNAEAGFVLSPSILTVEDYVGLYVSGAPISARRVSSFEIDIPAWAEAFYEPDVEISLSEMAVPKVINGPYSRGPLKEALIARQTAERRRLATTDITLDLGNFKSAVPLLAGSSVSTAIPAKTGTLIGADVTMVTFGKSPSHYAIPWTLALRSNGTDRKLAEGVIDTASLKDWEPAQLAFPDQGIEQIGNFIITFDIPANATILQPAGMALYEQTSNETIVSIDNIETPGLAPRITLRYMYK